MFVTEFDMFYQPHFEISFNNGAQITDEIISPAADGYGYRSFLEIRNATILNTGYYICHYKGNNETENPQVAVKTYVYVEGRPTRYRKSLGL